jgi:uncharacterized protein (TIGR00661 family)
MRILYGVQGTGNGHITRARALNGYFKQFGFEVDFLFSGRAPQAYFDMQEFGEDWRCHRGLTFAHQAGEINLLKTLRNNDFVELLKDVRNLQLDAYDLVITDFEPITAHAARLQGVPSLGIGHQYAFLHDVPTAGETLISQQLLRQFAPAQNSLGLHWHHFNSPILPPIAEIPNADFPLEEHKILVYLGFEDPEEVLELLAPFTNYVFVVYGPFQHYQRLGHIQLKPLSRQGFCRDLGACNGVISNAGFELASEAIHLGKKLLVKPLTGQMEQLSNAQALVDLGLGMRMLSLDAQVLAFWLDSFISRRMVYPNVALAIVEWISRGRWDEVGALSRSLWQETWLLNEGRAAKRVSAPAARHPALTSGAVKQTEEVIAGVAG